MSEHLIEFAQVYKRFGALEVLKGVSFGVDARCVHYIIGQSGAGKSVLIKQLVGLLRPDAGSIRFFGQELASLDEAGFVTLRKRCQMIFQNATLFDALSVAENVAMPIRKRFGVSRHEATARARQALERVHAAELVSRYPSELGVGVRKRIAIARAIALEPEVLLYDEPTTGLDPVSARRTDRLIREMADRLGITSVVVSHDLTSVRDTGDRVTFLHQGKVYFDGTPEALWASEDATVRQFVRGERPRW